MFSGQKEVQVKGIRTLATKDIEILDKGNTEHAIPAAVWETAFPVVPTDIPPMLTVEYEDGIVQAVFTKDSLKTEHC